MEDSCLPESGVHVSGLEFSFVFFFFSSGMGCGRGVVLSFTSVFVDRQCCVFTFSHCCPSSFELYITHVASVVSIPTANV